MARTAARQLGIEFIEREARSVDELRTSLRTLKTGEGDALFIVSDGMVISQAQLIVDVAQSNKLMTMFTERSSVVRGGLSSYGVNYYTIGRLAAKYVHKVLLGASPADLPVERSDRLELVINARIAREMGLTIPREVLVQADEVIK